MIEDNREGFGLNRLLEVLEVPKSTWYYSQRKRSYEEKHRHLKDRLLEIAVSHPEYGYRRATSELRDLGYLLNRKVVQRLHRHWDLSMARRVKKPGDNPVAGSLRRQERVPTLSLNWMILGNLLFCIQILQKYGISRAWRRRG